MEMEQARPAEWAQEKEAVWDLAEARAVVVVEWVAEGRDADGASDKGAARADRVSGSDEAWARWAARD